MKINKLLLAGITAASVFTSAQLVANAKVTETITYQAKTKKTTLYKSLPTTKKVKSQANYKLSGSFNANSIKSAHGVKYALLSKNGKTVGWFKLSSLYKVTTKTTTTKKVKPSATKHTESTSTSNNSNPSSTTSTNNTTSIITDPNASTAIANMDYSNAASNNPTSSVLAAMNQPATNWSDSTVLSAAAQAALNQVNSARATAGLSALTINDQLTKIAQMRAQQISTSFDHWDANHGLIAYDDAKQLGLDIDSHSTSLSENLGKSYYVDGDTPNAVSNKIISAFQAEGPENGDGQEHGHYVNDMDPNNKQVGIAFYYTPGTNDLYLAMEFGNYYK